MLAVFCGPAFAAAGASSIVRGNVRFQVLSPNLVRMEYSPTSRFVDEASTAVVGRDNWPEVAAQVEKHAGWLNISTGKLTASYKLGSGPFSDANLRITWSDKSGEHAWKPGDKDDKNLGGVPAALDNRSTRRVTDHGPLTRNGYYRLDDSQSALFDKATEWVKPRAEKDSQDWYFLSYGNDYAQALRTMAKLLGPIPMLPRYVFGSWFGSRAGYSAEQWKMIVEQFRDEKYPLDVLVLDSDSTTKTIWSGYTWDYEQMPDPKGFMEWMKNRNVKVTVNEHYNPITRDNVAQFDLIRKAMGLPENTKDIPHDIADKKYADLFMNVLHKPALDLGMAFWWQDGNAGTLMRGLDPLLWTRHVEYMGTQRITGKRSTAFCRLGTAVGSHRYGVFFTGDLTGVWESLPVLVPATIRGGNQLMPYMNNLCGGVHVADLPVELYQRWVQFGALSPVLWFHGVWGLRLPWEYGPEGEQTYRRFVGLRYALLPYIYSYSRIAHQSGLPLVRGMYLEYPDQDQAYASDQQYMFGRELLVAPVTAPGQGKTAKKEVFLPSGDDWFDYFTGDIYEGGRQIVHQCPIERMPLFVRAGSIIPMCPKMDSSDQAPLDRLTLDVYAGNRAAEFKLYEDDGLSLDYGKGDYAWTPIAFKPASAAGNYTLVVGPTQGKFAGQPLERRYVARLHGLFKPNSVTVNGAQLPQIEPGQCGPGWIWNSKSRTTTIRLPLAVPISEQLTVGIQGAGTFADAIALQKVLNLRQQVRQTKRLMKLRHLSLLGGDDIKKPPRVIRRTEDVERELTELVHNPREAGGTQPDFAAMRKRVLDVLDDMPFESDRQIPEIDPDAIRSTKKITNGKFTADEKKRIAKILRRRTSRVALSVIFPRRGRELLPVIGFV